jgi:outer membrane protein OmpA-like peptidoglycan-associated protein
MQTEGFGADQPIADNKTAAGRKLNRRVQFKIDN